MYLVLVIWLFLCGMNHYALRKKIYKNKNDIIFISSFFIVCLLIMGFRNFSVGVDTITYKIDFEYVTRISINDILAGNSGLDLEKGYLIFMKVISYISNNYYLFQFIVSAIYLYGMGNFLLKTSNNIFLCATLFLGLDLFLMTFNIQRQMLAVMFAINGLIYFNNKQFTKGIIFWMISLLFHRTAIFFILANLIFIFRNNKNLLRAASAIIVVIGINYKRLIPLVERYMPHYYVYFRNQKVMHTARTVWVIWIIILIISTYILLTKRFNNKERIIAIYSAIFVIMNIIGLYFNYAERIGLYFLPFCILLFDNFCKIFDKVQIKVIYNFSVVFCFIIYFLISSGSSQYIYEFMK